MTVTNTVDGTAGPARGLSARTLRTYAADWALFTDWCAATDTTALPADPHVVVDFLIGCPAAPGTQRCRVAAIDHHHTAHGHQRPGETVAVRAALGRPTGEPFHPTDGNREAVAAAEHALGPAVRGQPAQRRVDRALLGWLGGFAGGPAEGGTYHHRLPRPREPGGQVVVVDGGDPAPQRRGRGGASLQEVDDNVWVGG